MLKAKLGFLFSMILSGSIGLFVKFIPFTSGQIAFVRSVSGFVFLLLCLLISGKGISFKDIKKNLPYLVVSGAALGFNWMLLFEAYNYTSIATATICYYFAPVIVIFVSPFLLKEKLSLVKILCVLAALLGIIFVSGTGETGSVIGVLFGLLAALFYASIMVANKKLYDISGMESGFVQLVISAVVMGIYLVFTDSLSFAPLDAKETLLLVTVAVVHTGILYLLYFTCIRKLTAQTAAVFSYIDPVLAIVFSALFLKEGMTPLQILGGVLVIGAAFANEIYAVKYCKSDN